jgi:hypothetical protein
LSLLCKEAFDERRIAVCWMLNEIKKGNHLNTYNPFLELKIDDPSLHLKLGRTYLGDSILRVGLRHIF